MSFSALFVDCSEAEKKIIVCMSLTAIVCMSSRQERSLDNSYAALCPGVQAMATSGMATEQFSGFKF